MAKLKTNLPQRVDRLPWSSFHWKVLLALGVTWLLDGLEVTLKGAISGVLQDPKSLHLTPAEIGSIASCYITGAVLGSLAFGYLTDRYGRKQFFLITLLVYLLGVGLTAFSWNFLSFCLFRFITGAGIGGEYAAINSAIDELIPARSRGRVDLIINGTYWLGAALGAGSTLFFLNPAVFSVDLGWRLAFGIGGLLGLIILFFRGAIPESPRWLATHGHVSRANTVLKGIEKEVEKEKGKLPRPHGSMILHPQKVFGFGVIVRSIFQEHLKRSILGLALMASQAFLYNAIFFTYALVLTRFFSVQAKDTGLYLLPFALGNFFGPVVLGPLFDTVGRKPMISSTYFLSGALLLVTGYLFWQDSLTAISQTVLWTVIFFFASPAASSAYLTVSEIFPLEVRALAIAFFYSVGTAIGGIVGPWLFGHLIGTGSRGSIFIGYAIGAGLVFLAAAVELAWGVRAEGKSLESIAKPLSQSNKRAHQ